MSSSASGPARDNDLDDFEKELNSYIESEEKNKKEKENQNTMEKEKSGQGKSGRQKITLREQSDNEDSEVDDYNLTEDQKRALEELDNLKTELSCLPDEDPPEYDVTERLKILNEELKNDPTPVEKLNESKVVFKENLIESVAPPPEFSDDEGEKNSNSPKSTKTKTPTKQTDDKVDNRSETISASRKPNSGKKDDVLIEIDGQFQLVSADDVRAKDLGYVMDDDKNKENERKQNEKSNKAKLQPIPPGKPRPSTASSGSRRNVRTQSAKPRPQSAHGAIDHGSAIHDFNYNSPYALSPREKELMEQRKKALEKQRQDNEKKKKNEEQSKEKENQEAFEFWLKKKRENDRRRKIQEEDERKKNTKEDRKEENEEAFKSWLQEKQGQFRKEKLLKRRQDQEMHEGYYVRSREECDKAYKQWLKQKAIDARKARAAERNKAKLQRLAARRSRKSITLSKSIKEAQSFRYVDYYGYRF